MTPNHPGNAYLGVLVLGILLLHTGALLVKLGWWPRRTGRSRHCRRCDYLLDGLPDAADRCPECGLHLDARNVVRGDRPRRGRLAWLGVSLILTGAATAAVSLTDRFARIDWYAHYPASWVINDLSSSDAGRRGTAWAELLRRDRQNELSAGQRASVDAASLRSIGAEAAPDRDAMVDRLIARFDKLGAGERTGLLDLLLADLGSPSFTRGTAAIESLDRLLDAHVLSKAEDDRVIEFALQIQGAKPRGSWESRLLDLLGQRAAAGTLSGAQKERFFAQAMPATLRVRPDMIAGEYVPYWIDLSGRGPNDGWWSRHVLVGTSIDDGPSDREGGSGSGSGLTDGGMGSAVKVGRPGDHVLHVVFERAAYREDHHGPGDPPVWSRRYELSAPFKALPAGAENYVKLRREPELSAAIRRSLRVSDVVTTIGRPERIGLTVRVAEPKVGVAFDVFVRRADGKEYLVDTLHCAARASEHFVLGRFSGDAVADAAETVDVILRGSAKVARNTVDLYEIWDGELEFKGLTAKAFKEPAAR